MLMDYLSFMKYNDFSEKANAYDTQMKCPLLMKHYLEVTSRVSQKLLQAASQAQYVNSVNIISGAALQQQGGPAARHYCSKPFVWAVIYPIPPERDLDQRASLPLAAPLQLGKLHALVKKLWLRSAFFVSQIRTSPSGSLRSAARGDGIPQPLCFHLKGFHLRQQLRSSATASSRFLPALNTLMLFSVASSCSSLASIAVTFLYHCGVRCLRLVSTAGTPRAPAPATAPPCKRKSRPANGSYFFLLPRISFCGQPLVPGQGTKQRCMWGLFSSM